MMFLICIGVQFIVSAKFDLENALIDINYTGGQMLPEELLDIRVIEFLTSFLSCNDGITK